MAANREPTYSASDIVRAAVKAWGIALQGVNVRNVVRDTNRVPRLRDEPPSGNRSHHYTPSETVMVVDGLCDRSSMRQHDPDRLLSVLGIPLTVRQTARRAWAAQTGQARAQSTGKAPSRPKAAHKTPNRALGQRPVKRPVSEAPSAPSADAATS